MLIDNACEPGDGRSTLHVIFHAFVQLFSVTELCNLNADQFNPINCQHLMTFNI
jgi:hypothetical protein